MGFTDKQLDMFIQLLDRGGYAPISRIIEGKTLGPFQEIAIVRHLLTNRNLISLDTGMGKTLTAIGNLNLTLKKGKKFIFASSKSVILNMVSYFNTMTRYKVLVVTGSEESEAKFININLDNYDGLLMSLESFTSKEINKVIYERTLTKEITHVILDESHKVTYEDAYFFRLMRAICRHIDNVLFLTATPLRVDLKQFIGQLNILDEEIFYNIRTIYNKFATYDSNGFVTGFKDYELFEEMCAHVYFSYTRSDAGIAGDYNCFPIKADLNDYQLTVMNNNKLTKSKKRILIKSCQSQTFEEMKKYLRQQKKLGNKGLIYANIREIKDFLYKELSKEFSTKILDGRVKSDIERKEIEKDFNDNKYDFLIINLTESLNLQCQYILFWELTSDFCQMIGRGERGLKGNDLDIGFCITNSTLEKNFFEEHVRNNCQLLEKFAGKDLTAIKVMRID